MIGVEQASLAWQEHPGEVIVWPLGAIEQHDAHLPLATDAIQAEHLARALATELDAALLPVMALGTSFEHTGFRGSFSLRPETIAALVRDVADECERQGFRRLVMVNGHGGNFSYAPVVRDINRRDRALKIILVDWWTCAPGGIADHSASRGAEVHAGEFETSVMLAIRPDLVRPGVDTYAPETGSAQPLARSDLNTFGIGHFNPTGAIGFPSFASAEKGRAILAATVPRLVAHVRDRLARLREQPRYAGAGGIALRVMRLADLDEGMRLKLAAGWNQTEADWRRFLAASPQGCFVAVRDGAVLGSAATIRYGDGAEQVAWISMVLVDPQVRRAGIGTRLLERAIAHLADCPSIKLDATPAGRELYLQRGFVDERRLTRWVCAAAPADAGADARGAVALRPLLAGDVPAIAAFDRAASGLARATLIAALQREAPELALVAERAGAATGFILGRPGSAATQLGPLAAADLATARALVGAALARCAQRPVLIDALDAQGAFTGWLRGLGFVAQRPLIRMWRGSPGPSGEAAREYAIVGPEFG